MFFVCGCVFLYFFMQVFRDVNYICNSEMLKNDAVDFNLKYRVKMCLGHKTQILDLKKGTCYVHIFEML